MIFKGNKIIVDTTNNITTVTTDLIVEGSLETANSYYLEEYFYKKEENYDTQRHIQRCSV